MLKTKWLVCHIYTYFERAHNRHCSGERKTTNEIWNEFNKTEGENRKSIHYLFSCANVTNNKDLVRFSSLNWSTSTEHIRKPNNKRQDIAWFNRQRHEFNSTNCTSIFWDIFTKFVAFIVLLLEHSCLFCYFKAHCSMVCVRVCVSIWFRSRILRTI